MAKLTAAARNELPTGKFAGPGRTYPVEDPPHAKAAKSRASEMEHRGVISLSEKNHIDAKADKVLARVRNKSSGPHGYGR